MLDGGMAETGVTCTDCKADLDTTDAGPPETRRPCPACGSLARTVWVKVEPATITVTACVASAQVTLSDPERGWRGRWKQIEEAATKLAVPRGGAMGGEAIVAWQQDLLAFYVLCYHLKDALKAENPNGIARSVETAINTCPELALLADLANLSKHAKLTKPPRSGVAPTLGKLSGVSGAAGWVLSLPVVHGAQVLDGIAVAVAAVAAWRRTLAAVKLP